MGWLDPVEGLRMPSSPLPGPCRPTLRMDMFNTLNHANFRNPRDASVGSPAINSNVFAQACCVSLSTTSSSTTNQNGESWRVIQLALKLAF